MNYFLILIELWVLLLICMLIGRRICYLLPNIIKLSVGFYIAPILGLSFLILITTLYGWLFPFKFHYSLLITLAIVLFAFVYEKKKRQVFRDGLQICLFATIASLPILMPIIYYVGYNPFTDIFTYLVHGQWLQEHAFSEKAIASGFYPAMTQVTLYQKAGSRMGGSFLLGYVQSLFALRWSYYAYIPTIALAFVTGCLSLGGIIRQVVPTKRVVVLALALLPAFSFNGFVYGAEWGFFPQTFGLAFSCGLAVLLPFLSRIVTTNHFSFSKIMLYAIPIAICTAALLFSYNEPFPIFALGITLFFLLALFSSKNKIALLALFIFYTIEVLLLLNYEAIRIARNLLQTIAISHQASAIGWPTLWSPIQFLAHTFGMKSPFGSNTFRLDYIASVYLFPIFFIAICWILGSFVRRHPKRRLTLIFLLSVDFVLFLIFLKFRYFSPNTSNSAEVGFTFLQFKISKYAALFSLGLAGISLALIWQQAKNARLYLLYTYILMITFGLYIHSHVVVPNFTNGFITEVNQEKNPFDTLLQLRYALSAIPVDESIYIGLGEEHGKLRQMVAYILHDRKIASDYTDDGYISGSLPPEEKTMLPNKNKWLITLKPRGSLCESGEIVGPFLIQKAPFNHLILEKTESIYGTEMNSNNETWNWVNNAIDFYFAPIGLSSKARLEFNLTSFPTKRSFTVELKDASGKTLAKNHFSQSGEKSFKSPLIKVNSKHLILHVEADGTPIRISEGDTREAKFVIANVKFCS